MMDADRLFDACTQLLGVVADFYAAEGVALPARRYVSPGVPAWDCDQVTVYVEQVFSGLTDQVNEAPVDCLYLRSATIVVEVARCTPSIDDNARRPPSPADIEASANEVLRDPVLIANAALDAHKNGLLGDCHGLSIVEWEPLGPEGGYAGGRQRFRLLLTG